MPRGIWELGDEPQRADNPPFFSLPFPIRNRRQPPIPNALYGPSKAALTWYGVRVNAEDEWLNAFVLDPGWVQTEMGNTAAHLFGVAAAPLTVDESVDGLFRLLTTATKEEHGGKVVLYTGEVQVF